MDYYEILEIPRNADAEIIRKAYRKLALKWHPDKHQNASEADKMFKLISEAYEVLSDPEKKNVFDRYGAEGLRNGISSHQNMNRTRAFRFHDPFEVFRQFFQEQHNFFSSSFGSHFSDPFFNSPFDDDPFFNHHSPFGNPFEGGSLREHSHNASSSYAPCESSIRRSDTFSSNGFKTQQTQTTIVNGQRFTVTTRTDERGNIIKTTIYPDGTQTTTITATTHEQSSGPNRRFIQID